MESCKPNGTNFKYIDIDAIDNKRLTIANPKILKVDNAPSRATRKLHQNDVLFSMVRPYLKNIAFVTEEFENCIASTGFYVCIPNIIILYPKYLYYLMTTPFVIDSLMVYMKGDNSPSINNTHIENQLYPIPPIYEQRRIAKFIEIHLNTIEGKAH